MTTLHFTAHHAPPLHNTSRHITALHITALHFTTHDLTTQGRPKMYRAIATIEGIAPLTQSRQHRVPFLEGESHEAYEARTWREKANFTSDDEIFVPAMAFKQSIDTAAKRLAIPDPDNKRATLTKYFTSDTLCEDHMLIGIKKNDMKSITINANSDGVRGSGKRVQRTFPMAEKWGGKATFLIMDHKVTPEVFERVLTSAGRSVGVGQYRPEKGSLNGRFKIVSVQYQDV